MTGQKAISCHICRSLLLACLGLFLIAQTQSPAPTPAPGTPVAPQSVGPVYIISLRGEVNDIMRDRLKRQTDEALAAGASAIVLQMDTWGGLVTSALEMCDQIKSLKVPTLAWVKPKAISAGAMISLACDQIVVADPARIGDCMPITGTGQPLPDAEREKVETVIREEFRDSGVRHGYPLALCTAMVTRGPAVYLIEHQSDHTRRYVFATELPAYGLTTGQAAAAPQADPTPKPLDEPDATSPNPLDAVRRALSPDAPGDSQPAKPAPAEALPTAPDPSSQELPYDAGQWRIVRQILAEKQLLTMSQDKAINYGFAKTRIDTDAALAQYLQVPVTSLTFLQANWSEKLVDFLTSNFVRGLLTIILLMAVYSEMQTPGLGLAAGVAVVAGALLLGAPYLAGMADMWELLIILLGVILLAIEIFVIPGFGVTGFTGLLLMFVGLLLTFVPSEPGPNFIPQLTGTWEALQNGFLTILASFALALVGMYFLSKYLGSIPLFNRLILTAGITEPPADDLETLGDPAGNGEVKSGDTGRAVNDLRPAGRAQFGQLTVDVVADGSWIESGSAVTITTVAGNRVVVRKT